MVRKIRTQNCTRDSDSPRLAEHVLVLVAPKSKLACMAPRAIAIKEQGFSALVAVRNMFLKEAQSQLSTMHEVGHFFSDGVSGIRWNSNPHLWNKSRICHKCCRVFVFLLINTFIGSLHSILLHGLELISFSAISGNKYCHDKPFSLFLGLINKYFFGFHTPAQIGAC